MSQNDRLKEVGDQVNAAVETAKEAVQDAASKVSDFFQGNPFETEVGKKIEIATDAERIQSENWGLNMEICDYINFTSDGGRNALRAIRKRLQTQMGKNNATVMYTLTVLETCVKNCDQRFIVLVCQKEFINELVRLISAKYDAPQAVQERVLELIQAWSDAFKSNPALVGVTEVYEELKSKGVEFPATDFDKMAPINTPKRTVYTEPPHPQQTSFQPQQLPLQQVHQTYPVPISGQTGASIIAHQITTAPPTATVVQQHQDPIAKLRGDVDVVTINITVLRDLLSELKPGEELPEEIQLMKDLHESLKQMQQRIVDLINSEYNDNVTFELITVNQEINNVFEKYDRYNNKDASGKVPMTPETEDDRQLRQQLESFGVYEGVGTSRDTDPNRKQQSSTAEAAAEPQLDSLRTVALEKPMLTDDQAKEVADWLGQQEEKKPEKTDDGL